ncbi:class I SAM-dependent methyltransferase [Veillonella agrestimuris]|uniref:class I SAM-dependent methyltransferase n=1 Tax=Veillonella agrestimuris TaxID=2941340 RepID=UPI00203F9270|nr:class I SAM-dependent methyltransferase [Veillonella agrestimuris]
MIITTSQKITEEKKLEAKRLALEFSLSYVERAKRPLQELLTISQPVAVVGNQDLTIHFNEDQRHSFHLSMAQLRLLRIDKDGDDHLVSAVNQLIHNKDASDHGSVQNLSMLDCTLGLGGDSIILSYAFPNASIESIEGSFPIWLATTYGLQNFHHEKDDVTAALRRITTIHGDFRDILAKKEKKSVHIIYFDPMFERPIEESPQFKPLRGYTVESTITDAVMMQSKEVARLGVIIKERPSSSIFRRYPPHAWVGGKYSRIGYGIYYV